MLSRQYPTMRCPLCHPDSLAGRAALCSQHHAVIARLSLLALQQDQASALLDLHLSTYAVQAN